MNVVLMGYRGSGKTSVGRLLASRLWMDFADVDAAVIERFGGEPIHAIWQLHGEPAFRAVEAEVTAELLSTENTVLALGGGTVMFEDARRAVVEAGDTRRVYLSCRAAVLAERIAADPKTLDDRPDLTPLGGGVEEVEAVLAERDPVYREVADVVFDVTYTSIEQTVQYLCTHHL